jgi:translocation and assembly module TamA
VRWQRGALYEARKVEAMRRALIETGLFSMLQITPTADSDHSEDVLRQSMRRKDYTIGMGLAYNTSQGPPARVFWENRNLLGNAESLRMAAEGGQQIARFRANFRTDQDFLASAEIVNDMPIAYHSPSRVV